MKLPEVHKSKQSVKFLFLGLRSALNSEREIKENFLFDTRKGQK